MSAMDWSKQAGRGPQAYQSFLVPAMFEPFGESLVAKAGVRPGQRVLDVACGTGAVTRIAARAAGPDGAVVGTDLGEPTLELARLIDPGPDAAPIRFVQADAAELPVDSEAFDVALCQQGLQFFDDRTGALIEMYRALKPGGTVAIACWWATEHQPHRVLAAALERHLGPEAAAGLRAPYTLSDQAELAGAVAAAGFDDVTVVSETIDCTWASHAEWAPLMMAAAPFLSQYAAAPFEVRQAVALETAEGLAEYALPDGRLRAPMTTNVAIARR